MRRNGKKLLSALLLAVFLVSTGILVMNFYSYGAAEDAYSDASAIAGMTKKPAPHRPGAAETKSPAIALPAREPRTAWVPAPVEEDDPVMEELALTDLEALRQVNPDVIAWIRIPGTKIDYPVLQGQDNDFYLDHNWKGEGQIAGSVFLEYTNEPDLTDYNSILYGHNMANGTIFHDLHKLNYPAYRGTIPYVYVATDGGVLRYEIFSTYDAALDSAAYELSFRDYEGRADFLTHALENSLFDLGVEPELTDQILTLSTCSGIGYGHRRVVHARLKMTQILLEE